MSDLTAEQIESFRQRLLEAKASAEAILRQTAGDEKPVEASGSSIGRLSRMDAIQVQAMAQMSRRQLQVRLLQFDAALATIENGTYGTCRSCKGPISLPRLDAVPEAPFCMECQESFEN
jgi:DnaK suppressor protein